MATWRELSEDSLLAAEALLQEGHYRSCISRAYYASYCTATHEIVRKLTTFFHGRNNSSHELVLTYVQNNLTIAQARNNAIDTYVRLLRIYREDADYRPQTTVDEPTARDCVRAAAEVQRQLWGSGK